MNVSVSIRTSICLQCFTVVDIPPAVRQHEHPAGQSKVHPDYPVPINHSFDLRCRLHLFARPSRWRVVRCTLLNDPLQSESLFRFEHPDLLKVVHLRHRPVQ